MAKGKKKAVKVEKVKEETTLPEEEEVKEPEVAEEAEEAADELLEKAEAKEEIKEDKTLQAELKKVKEKMEKLEWEIWKANWNPVFQKSWFIKTKVLKNPIPMFLLPEKFRTYLRSKGFWTNVYEKDKEWLEKHGADMEIINELKVYLSEHYNK